MYHVYNFLMVYHINQQIEIGVGKFLSNGQQKQKKGNSHFSNQVTRIVRPHFHSLYSY